MVLLIVVVVCVDFNIWYLGSCHRCRVVVIFVFVVAFKLRIRLESYFPQKVGFKRKV